MLVAQCGALGEGGIGDDGGSDDGDGAPAATSDAAPAAGGDAAGATDATTDAGAAAASDTGDASGVTAETVAPPAGEQAAAETPAPADGTDPTAAGAATDSATAGADGTDPAAPPTPPPSGPPPVAEGTMPELRMDPGGPAHALFAAKFFSGPVDGFTAASSDTGVATVGVSPPDMLIVGPVSDGSASVTVTATGPGGSATQTFTVLVGAAAQAAARTRAAAAPAPAPPAAAPPPAPLVPEDPPPTTEPGEPFVPEDALPVEALPPDAPAPAAPPADDQSLYSLATEPVTAPPALYGRIPDQTLIVGNSGTVNVSHYFSGIIQGWSVASSAPAAVPASVSIGGIVSFSGDALGTATVTVTAANDAGSASYGFTVSVKTASQVLLTTVGGSPQLLVPVGQTVTLDLSNYFSEAATQFDVTYNSTDPNRLVDVTMQGSIASIRGLRGGSVTITLVASSATSRISRPATVQVIG